MGGYCQFIELLQEAPLPTRLPHILKRRKNIYILSKQTPNDLLKHLHHVGFEIFNEYIYLFS